MRLPGSPARQLVSLKLTPLTMLSEELFTQTDGRKL